MCLASTRKELESGCLPLSNSMTGEQAKGRPCGVEAFVSLIVVKYFIVVTRIIVVNYCYYPSYFVVAVVP